MDTKEIEKLVNEMCPVMNQGDPMWEQLAQATLRGCINEMVERKVPIKPTIIKDVIGILQARL